MKTYKNLYPQICDFATLYAAYRRARCGKRDRVAVASFEFDLERNLLTDDSPRSEAEWDRADLGGAFHRKPLGSARP